MTTPSASTSSSSANFAPNQAPPQANQTSGGASRASQANSGASSLASAQATPPATWCEWLCCCCLAIAACWYPPKVEANDEDSRARANAPSSAPPPSASALPASFTQAVAIPAPTPRQTPAGHWKQLTPEQQQELLTEHLSDDFLTRIQQIRKQQTDRLVHCYSVESSPIAYTEGNNAAITEVEYAFDPVDDALTITLTRTKDILSYTFKDKIEIAVNNAVRQLRAQQNPNHTI